MNFFSDRLKLKKEYEEWMRQCPEAKDCTFNVITFLDQAGYLRDLRSLGMPGTNRRYINDLPNRKLAELTINHHTKPDFDYNYDDEPEWCGEIDVFTTSDGQEFNDIEPAIDHEIWWLEQPHKEEHDG